MKVNALGIPPTPTRGQTCPVGEGGGGRDGFREGEENVGDEFTHGELLGDILYEWDIFERKKCRRWFVKNNSPLKIRLYEWEFIFYNKQAQTNDIDNYMQALQSALRSNNKSIRELHEMMRDYKKFVAFKNKIKYVMPQKNMNNIL